MPNVRIAISIEKPLFKEMGALAGELGISRSRLFALAAREFVQRHKSQKLLDAINAAHSGQPDPAEENAIKRMRVKHQELVKDQ